MKKTEISKIEQLPKSTNERISVEAQVVDEMLILDIYEFDSRITRIALNSTDWINFEDRTGKWSHKKALRDYHRECSFYDGIYKVGCNDEKLIKRFLQEDESYRYYSKDFGILAYVENYQQDILIKQQSKRHDTKEKKTQELVSQTEGFSEGFEEWATDMFEKIHPYPVYYKNDRKYSTLHCSKCGKTYHKLFNPADYEESLMAITKPVAGDRYRCNCGNYGELKCFGRSKAAVFVEERYYDAIPMDKGICIKYISTSRITRRDEKAEIKITEVCRNFYKENQYSRAFFKKSWYSGETYWDYKNWSGQYAIHQESGYISPGGQQCIQKAYPYNAFENIRNNNVSFVEYLKLYIKYPKVEMLAKAKAYTLIRDIIWKSVKVDFKAKKLCDILKVREERVKDLMADLNDVKLLMLYQMERKTGTRFSEENIEKIKKLSYWSYDRFYDISKFVDVNKALNYINRDKNRDITLYHDYLKMTAECGYEFDSIKLFPKDLKAEHDKRVTESNLAKRDKRKQEALDKFPEIQRRYKSLMGRYAYTAEGYSIRPVRDAGEIIEEGAYQHHCVGSSDTYLKRHNTGESFILVMRKVEKPETPYITIEIKKDTICQWYEAYDKKKTKEVTEPFLDRYIEFLKEKKNGRNRNVQKLPRVQATA